MKLLKPQTETVPVTIGLLFHANNEGLLGKERGDNEEQFAALVAPACGRGGLHFLLRLLSGEQEKNNS